MFVNPLKAIPVWDDERPSLNGLILIPHVGQCIELGTNLHKFRHLPTIWLAAFKGRICIQYATARACHVWTHWRPLVWLITRCQYIPFRYEWSSPQRVSSDRAMLCWCIQGVMCRRPEKCGGICLQFSLPFKFRIRCVRGFGPVCWWSVEAWNVHFTHTHYLFRQMGISILYALIAFNNIYYSRIWLLRVWVISFCSLTFGKWLYCTVFCYFEPLHCCTSSWLMWCSLDWPSY